MNIRQSTNNAIELLASMAEKRAKNLVVNAEIALSNYRQALSTGLDAGTFVITEYDIDEHGIEHSQYFVGAGVTFTSFDHIATGCGDNPHEAIDDCLEQIAMQGIDIPDTLDTIASGYPLEPSAYDEDKECCADEELTEEETEECMETSERHFYLSIRYNRRFSHTKTAQAMAESIVNGNCNFVIEELQEMPTERSLAVTAYILEYLPDEDKSYRNRFMSALGNKAD